MIHEGLSMDREVGSRIEIGRRTEPGEESDRGMRWINTE